jgi:hypothetical protein
MSEKFREVLEGNVKSLVKFLNFLMHVMASL